MILKPIQEDQKALYNKLVTHLIQSWEWGEARKNLGIPVLRYGLYKNSRLSTTFQLTLHKMPLTKKWVGYLPKGPFPDSDLAEALKKIGRENKCAFIKVEPNIPVSTVIPAEVEGSHSTDSMESVARDSSTRGLARNDIQISNLFVASPKPLFTKYNFIIDLTQSEEELLKNMHPKTRYNIKVAQKHGVKVEERVDDEAFEIYLKLYIETTKRQGYHGHNEQYHSKIWQVLKKMGMARLLIATYPKPITHNPLPLTAWMLLSFKDTLYYPYGGSSLEHKEVMANNLVCWEAIKLGKKLGLKKFDMWGALRPDANPNDPWYGFHKFKQGYGGKLVEYIGTYDLVLDWSLYLGFTAIDKMTPLKITLLKLLKK